jgi:phytoene dehydrogenase-like protein
VKTMARTKAIVVGGGLAGLTAAAYLTRGGVAVTVFERAQKFGGRAQTGTRQGFSFNLGPHALYSRGPAAAALRELGVTYTGKLPALSGAYAIRGRAKQTLPQGLVSLLTTGLLGLTAKLEMARLLGALAKIDASRITRLSVSEWLAQTLRQAESRQLVEALFRLTTYANEPERMSAGVALAQLQMGLSSGVLYLDGGWQSLVDGLRAVAEKSGVKFVAGAKVEQVEYGARAQGVRLADGSHYEASAVIVATSPAEAAALVQQNAVLRRLVDSLTPVKAACLDVALRRLPQPRIGFALGIDRPLYLSVHSLTAKLAPEGGALIHVAKYLGSNPGDNPAEVEAELEEVLDLIQPGWRDVLVERQFLPKMIVSHALATAAEDGLSGRPKPDVAGVEGLYVAGDWVGAEGWLADASVASAKQAATLILQRHCLQALAA